MMSNGGEAGESRSLHSGRDDKALANSVLDSIQKIDGVESTDTHILIE